MFTYCLTQSALVFSALVFSLDNPVAPLQRNQNFNSLTLSASGFRSPSEAPGISASFRFLSIIYAYCNAIFEILAHSKWRNSVAMMIT